MDGAGDNHTVGIPGGLCLIAENGDVVALGDASLLEFNRHSVAGNFNGRPQRHSLSCTGGWGWGKRITKRVTAALSCLSVSDVCGGTGAGVRR